MTKETLKIGIIAAEHSGDRLGAKLLESLQRLYKLKIYGIGGPEVSSFNISSPAAVNYQDLQVMGLIEPIINLPRILSIRKKLLKLFINEGIDLFIGVDSPDFNMFFHKKLKADHVKTVQVVSPSVWGWRENRLTAIDSYIDITMCLFKFEHEFYNQKNISSFFLGHPFSDFKPSDFNEVMSNYQLSHSRDFISILPGSRKSEISHMMPIFIQAAQEISIHNPNVFFLIPAPNEVLASMIHSFQGLSEIKHKVSINASKDFLSVSNFSIVTSGTASLEAVVLGSLPIICYKTNKLNYAILSRMIKTPFIGLPNLLLQKHLFPELVQKGLSVQKVVESYKELNIKTQKYKSSLQEIKHAMRGEGFMAAAKFISSLM